MSLSASEAFDLLEIGRCDFGGDQWVVFTDGAYRHVVSASHFDSCGRSVRERRTRNTAPMTTASGAAVVCGPTISWRGRLPRCVTLRLCIPQRAVGVVVSMQRR
jgi:hypothetical protein